jgi:hypothetical protein
LKEGLQRFNQFLEATVDPSSDSLLVVAQYVTEEGRQFAAEVAAGIEALEQIQKLAANALKSNEGR